MCHLCACVQADGTVLRDLAGPARAVEPEALDFIRVDRFKEGAWMEHMYTAHSIPFVALHGVVTAER